MNWPQIILFPIILSVWKPYQTHVIIHPKEPQHLCPGDRLQHGWWQSASCIGVCFCYKMINHIISKEHLRQCHRRGLNRDLPPANLISPKQKLGLMVKLWVCCIPDWHVGNLFSIFILKLLHKGLQRGVLLVILHGLQSSNQLNGSLQRQIVDRIVDDGY